jgi:hypothetical protein
MDYSLSVVPSRFVIGGLLDFVKSCPTIHPRNPGSHTTLLNGLTTDERSNESRVIARVRRQTIYRVTDNSHTGTVKISLYYPPQLSTPLRAFGR